MSRDPRQPEQPATGRVILAFTTRVFVFALVCLVAYVMTAVVAVNARAGGMRGLRFTNIPLEAPTFGGQTSFMFREVPAIRDIDVLWIGSSHAYRTFDPRFFAARGLSTFNMGTTAQTPLNTFFLLREYLGSVQPKAVVLEVYWNVLTWDGVESTLDIIANADPATWMLQMAIATRDVRAVNALLRRVVDFRRPAIDAVQPTLFVGDTYVAGGFVEKDSLFSGDRTWPVGALDVRGRQLHHLEMIAELLHGAEIPALLMIQPLPATTLDAITNRDELHDMVDAIARRHGLPYVDFNGLVTLDDATDYFDSHHLSQRGLQKFLPVVQQTIVDLGLVARP